MRYFWIVFLASLSLAGCNATNSDVSFTGPSGQNIHSAKCSQFATEKSSLYALYSRQLEPMASRRDHYETLVARHSFGLST
jgi:hypothetical protein